MKRLFSIGCLLFLLNGCEKEVAQDPVDAAKADSLAYFFERANLDSLPVSERRLYAQKAISIISQDKNDSMNRVNYFKVANRYWNMNALEDYKKTTLLVVEKAKQGKDDASLAKGYKYLGDYYRNKYIPDSSYYYYFEAEKLYRILEYNSEIARVLLDKAALQFTYSDYVGSEKSLFQALKISKTVNEDFLLFEIHNSIYCIFIKFKEYDKALEYQRIALNISKEGNIPSEYQSAAKSLSGLGTIYLNRQSYSTAISYYELALQQPNLSYDHKNLYSQIINNRAVTKFYLRDFQLLPKLYYESLEVSESISYFPIVVLTHINLSNYYAFKKDTSKAYDHAQKAYKVSKENNLPNEILHSLQQLVNLNHQKASDYTQEYIRLEDSLQRAERKVRNQFARIEYETEELATEKELLIKQRRTIIYLALLLVLIGTIFFAMRHRRTRNKQAGLLRKQQLANEEIYRLMMEQHQKIEEGKQLEKRRISRELHDGVMGKLTSIRLNLFVLSKKTDPQTINSCLGHIDQIQEVEAEIRAIAYDLRKSLFAGTISFVTIVRNLFGAMPHSPPVEFKLEVDESIDWALINGGTKLHIYRILQEALQNCVKYANASQILVSMQQSVNTLTVTIADDGIGFDSKQVPKGLGIKNIRERANEIGGKIQINATEGHGTRITLTIPYTNQ